MKNLKMLMDELTSDWRLLFYDLRTSEDQARTLSDLRRKWELRAVGDPLVRFDVDEATELSDEEYDALIQEFRQLEADIRASFP
ncbi:MAG: hypothetical protein HY221_00195 [Candidatus Sungbacteria bacterium]|uniref:Uncharacterized protein n=1 Tax=Candidatus Sungiibacteriota bacterium TaxID=2750080 RepID=A0A932VQQ6_9BACT|nr:hypothetical protein [Candidatus Sungbacteria bacterium]